VVGGNNVASKNGNEVAGRGASRRVGIVSVVGRGAFSTVPNNKSIEKCIVMTVEK
jgi:hypothetical protein